MRKPITTFAAVALSCLMISAGACTSDTRGEQSPWFVRGAPDATDTPLEERKVLIRSTETGTEGVVLEEDTDIEVTDGEIQRPSAEQWKPVSGLGQIHGLELMQPYDEDAYKDLLRQTRSRVGIVRGMVRERDRRLELRDPAFQTCRAAEALDFEAAPRASDECYYIDGEEVEGRLDVEARGNSLPNWALTVSFGAEASERAEYQCTVILKDERKVVLPAVRQFRVWLKSFHPAVVSEGSVESTCTTTDGGATSSQRRVEDVSGWVSGTINSPGIALVNIAVRLQVSASDGEDGDGEELQTLSFWTNLAPDEVPFSVD